MHGAATVAENYLLRRQFPRARVAARDALITFSPPPTPFAASPAPLPSSTQRQGLVSLRPSSQDDNSPNSPNSPNSSISIHQDIVVRLCVVWMQATAELHHTESNVGGSGDEEASVDLAFIPTMVHQHFPTSSPNLPYLASIVWLTYLAKVGQLQIAKEHILKFKCSPEGRLYTQAHWRAVTASLGQLPSAENMREAQSRYEHLIEVLVLDILVPLKEDANALRLIDTDVGVSKQRRQSLWKIVEGQWEDSISIRSTQENVNKQKRTTDKTEAATEAAAAAAAAAAAILTAEAEATALLEKSAVGKLAAKRKGRTSAGASSTVEQGLTREDVEILGVGLAGLVLVGLGAFMLYRRRGSITKKIESIGTLFQSR